MKNKKKIATGFAAGIAFGVIGVLLLTPKKREDLSRSLTYKVRKLALNFITFINSIKNNDKYPDNVVKQESKNLVLTSNTKAKKVLKDINEMTKEANKK